MMGKKIHSIVIPCLISLTLMTTPAFSINSVKAQSSAQVKTLDLNGDKVINIADVMILATAFNTAKEDAKYNPVCDLNEDGAVNIADVMIIAAKFNTVIEETSKINIPWDWSGVIGTGQSLAVGAEAGPALSTSQPYNNLKLSLENVAIPPLDPDNSLFKMVPLVEPIRVYGYYAPNIYPGNIFGETPHTAMAGQITSMVRSNWDKDYITAHTVIGESGQGIDALSKGATETSYSGRAYAATLFEVTAIKRLAAKAGKTYGVGAIIMTHGEKDSGNTNYENELHTLWADYNKDIRAITGQSQKIPLLLTQQHSSGTTGTSASTLAQWRIGVDYPGDIICVGPNYQHTYAADGIHMTANGYRELGELYGKVYYEKVVLDKDWQPLQPTNAEKSGRVITVNFHVPVAPLKWDTKLPSPNQSTQTEWKNGKGFEVYTQNKKITISSVEISGNSVKITCTEDLPSSGLKVGYAFNSGGIKRPNGTSRWGLLMDSDPATGDSTGLPIPNYCVSFELPVP